MVNAAASSFLNLAIGGHDMTLVKRLFILAIPGIIASFFLFIV